MYILPLYVIPLQATPKNLRETTQKRLNAKRRTLNAAIFAFHSAFSVLPSAFCFQRSLTYF
jgi:hypothetical protein